MGIMDNMAAKLAEQSAKRKAELAATVNDIKGEDVPAVVAEKPKKAPRKRTVSKPKEAPKAAPVAEEEETTYEAKRGRKSKYQPKDPRHPMTVVFSESQYQRVRKYAFDHSMSISDVLIEAFAQMTGED